MRLRVVCFILAYGYFLTVSGKSTCPWSKITVEKVDTCPMNKTAVEKRKERKNCEALAKRQNCTDPTKFSYHCVMNENENALIEVCAPEYNIVGGYCAEYNTLGEGIFPHYGLPCSDLTPPCDYRYVSTDAYKYQGCYDVVKKRNTVNVSNMNTTIPAELSSSIDSTSREEKESQELGKDVIAALVVFFIFFTILALVITGIWLRRSRKSKRNRRVEEWYNSNDKTVFVPLLSENVRKHQLDRSDYEAVIRRGEILRSTELEHEEGEAENENNEKMEKCEETTRDFIASYNRLNERFIETGLTKACKEKLKKFGFVVLTGKQGSGKTSIAIHIMSDQNYKEWKRLKLTSWADLLVLNFTENTLIYIDNLFDGFVYYLDLDKWWDSLMFFYFERVKQMDNVHLLITAKETELERACAFINKDEQTIIRTCLVREESFPLSYNEKIAILNSQIQLANAEECTETPFISKQLKSDLTNINCPVGFPLCAHMYAFEKEQTIRDISIFQSPRSYVRNQINQRTEADETGGVKTLFLLIIFHTCLESSENLDLKHQNDCEIFFGEKCSADLIKTLGLLSFANLYERANELKETILIEHSGMFEFKHQIYLEGAIDYFFRRYFNAVVDHFPLSILRAYKMQDHSKEQIPKLIERMKTEIAKEVLSEALSCKVFQEFEHDFCNNIQQESELMSRLLSAADKASGFKFPVIFWANKYNLPRLSKTFVDFAAKNNENEPLQFYLAMFGICCASDEGFIKRAKDPLNVDELKRLVLEFKTSEGMIISHLILSSKRSDFDAYQCLIRILSESEGGSNINFDKKHLDCVLKQNEYSRLLCLFEVLKHVTENAITDSLYISILGKELKSASSEPDPDNLLQLELLCRISILFIHGANGFRKKSCNEFFNDRNYYPKIIPPERSRLQKDMAKRIKHCLKSLDGKFPRTEKTIPPLKPEAASTLMTEIAECIAILVEREEKFFSKVT